MSAANQEGHSLGEWGNSFDIPLWRRRIRNSVLVSVNCHLDTVRSHLGEIGVFIGVTVFIVLDCGCVL